jgi:hypothetical protein
MVLQTLQVRFWEALSWGTTASGTKLAPESSSNFREFENVVKALKEEGRQGHLQDTLI